jgi:hypothetical protein
MADKEYSWLVGCLCVARTTTPGSHAIKVEVTSIEDAGPNGVEVWGYRQYQRRAQQARRTAYPRRYFIPTAWLPSNDIDGSRDDVAPGGQVDA